MRKYITRTFKYMEVTITAYDRTKGSYEYDCIIPPMDIDKVMQYIKKNVDNSAIAFDVKRELIFERRKISIEKFIENSEVVN